MNRRKARQKLDEMRGGEWWKSSSQETVYAAYDQLVGWGLEPEEALSVIGNVMSAISAEYGD